RFTTPDRFPTMTSRSRADSAVLVAPEVEQPGLDRLQAAVGRGEPIHGRPELGIAPAHPEPAPARGEPVDELVEARAIDDVERVGVGTDEAARDRQSVLARQPALVLLEDRGDVGVAI